MQDRSNWTDQDYEQAARRQGWDPDKPLPEGKERVDARTFVERGDTFTARQKERAERAEQELASLRADAQAFKEFMQASYAEKEAQYQSQIESLKAQQAQAIADGNGQQWRELDNQITQMESQRPQAPVDPVQTQQIPDFESAFLSKNDWYGHDPLRTKLADGISADLANEGVPYGSERWINEVDRRVRQMVPERFENMDRMDSAVETVAGERIVSSEGGRTYESLPADAKAACDKFVSQGLMTKEEYISTYEWE